MIGLHLPRQAGYSPWQGRHLQYLHTTRLVYLHKVPNALRCGSSCCICFDAKPTNGRKNFPVLNVPGNSLIFCLRGWGLNLKKHIFFLSWQRSFMRQIMNIEPRGYFGYRFASLLPSDGAVGHSLLQRFVNVDITPQQTFKVGFIFYFFLTNDYNHYI